LIGESISFIIKNRIKNLKKIIKNVKPMPKNIRRAREKRNRGIMFGNDNLDCAKRSDPGCLTNRLTLQRIVAILLKSGV